MAKQLLIYENVVPVSSEQHKNYSVKPTANYEFATSLMLVPILASEFQRVCLEYPIVFIAVEGETPLPVAVLSLSKDSNSYIDSDFNWDAEYIPAFVRRYPFVFSISDDQDQYILCVDQGYEGVQENAEGESLFVESGEPTEYVKGVLEFLKQYQVEHERTKAFCKALHELNVFDRKQLAVSKVDDSGSSEEEVMLSGFMAIDRGRIATLTDDFLLSLSKDGGLELAHYHFASLSHFSSKRFVGSSANP